MVVQHEEQHDETMLATLQLRQGPPVLLDRRAAARRARRQPGARVRARRRRSRSASTRPTSRSRSTTSGPRTRSTSARSGSARVPVSNRQWQEFIADGGYDRRELWSDRGLGAPDRGRPRARRCSGPRTAPGAGSASRKTCRRDEPVQHICYFEAEAFARWCRRAAADRDRVGEGLRLGPGHGHAAALAVGQRAARRTTAPTWAGPALRPAPVGAYPASASAYGAEQMIGDVWEWTSSDFQPWPGFTPMIYRAYSEPFFGGDYKVLRGGSWAVAAVDDPALVPQLGPPDPAADLHRRAAGLGRLSVPSPRLAGRAALARRAAPGSRRTACSCSRTRRAARRTAG